MARLAKHLAAFAVIAFVALPAALEQGSATVLAGGLRAEVQQLDADLPLSDVETLAQRFQRQRWYLSVFGTVFLIFAVVAMAMAPTRCPA